MDILPGRKERPSSHQIVSAPAVQSTIFPNTHRNANIFI